MVRKTRLILAAALLPLPGMLAAQDDDWCRESREYRDDRGWACDVREFTMEAPAGVLTVDGGTNGGIAVEGWDEGHVRVVLKVFAHARTDGEAGELIRGVRVAPGDRLEAEGPRAGRRSHWGVSYRIFVPRATGLSLTTHNGGIRVEGVAADVRFDALNGGVSLVDLSGHIRGETTNGGLTVRLTGESWEGEGMDVRTRNGGVRVEVPERYNAHIETGTVNGGMTVDFPVMVEGRIGRQLSFDVGRGGATVRAVTTNGGVRILRR